MPTLSPVARAHRADLSELVRLAENDLSLAMRGIVDAVEIRDGLLTFLPRLMDMYGAAAATLAADWYDELRAQTEARGSFRAVPAVLPDTGRTDSLARWSAGAVFTADPSPAGAVARAAGGLQRIIFNADRETVTYSSVQDRAARGWRREGRGDCDLCTLLLGRGAVYTEASSQFETHDRCRCIGVPAF
jgi:hypothetical protein